MRIKKSGRLGIAERENTAVLHDVRDEMMWYMYYCNVCCVLPVDFQNSGCGLYFCDIFVISLCSDTHKGPLL